MSISSRIEQIEQHIEDDYSVLTLGGADLTNVDKNIFNLKPQWQDRLKYYLANGTDTIWNNWEKVSGTGETLSLTPTIKGKMKVDLKGNTYQYTTTGKNLCYFSNFTEHGVNFNGSEINVGNTYGDVIYVGSNFNLQDDTSKSGKTYTIYACVNGTKQTGSSGTGISINFAKTGVPIAFQVSLTSSEGSFNNRIYVGTITLAQNEVFRNVSVVTNNAITANINIKVMIVEGNYTEQTIGDYEPYTNGASPNPDYPQDIQVVSGDNTIKVANGDNTEYEEYPISLGNIELCKIGTYQDKIAKSTGKNLFDDTLELGSLDGIGRNVSSNADLRNVNYISVKPNTQYTIEIPYNTRIASRFYNSSKTYVSSGTTTNKTYTFTTPNDCYYARFSFLDQTNTSLPVQLNEGSTALPYEPYGKVWYLNKQIGKVVLDGSETWYIDAVYQGITQFRVNIDNVMWANDYIVRVVSNYFKGVIYANSWTIDNSATTQSNSKIRLMTSLYSNVDDFKTWLSTHNTIVYYVLATPTYEEITDTTLLNQLNALENANSYNNTTNVSQVNDDMPFVLDITALKEMA